MAQNVLYVPAGVPSSQPTTSPSPAVPFDRAFFERMLPQAIHGFSEKTACNAPLVLVTTVDGVTHYVKGISGVADAWVALHVTRQSDEHDVQVFVPYQTIFRVEIDPCSEQQPRRLGFDLAQPQDALALPLPETVGEAGTTVEGKRAKRKR